MPSDYPRANAENPETSQILAVIQYLTSWTERTST